MQLAERHIIKSTEHHFVEIDGLALQSKNLYNAANYVIRLKLPKYKDKVNGRNILVYTIGAI